MKLSLQRKNNINYLAEVITVKELRNHPDPEIEKLRIVVHKGFQIITDISTKIGDTMIYFPVGSKIEEWFLKENNLFRDPSLNLDPEKTGMFNDNCAVKCIKLRGQKSEGFVIPYESLSSSTGTLFDSIDDKILISKYVPAGTKTKLESNLNKKPKTKEDKINSKIEEILIPSQFRFHSNTPHLQNELSSINLTDYVSITQKIHGSSGIASNVLIYKKSNWFTKAFRKLFKLENKEYGYIYSSGKPKSNLPKGIVNRKFENTSNYYGSDKIWQYSFDVLLQHLYNGLTIYYEIVGYTPEGMQIQKGYDYGCVPPEYPFSYTEGKHYKIFIYRITQTSYDDNVIEFSNDQIKEFCESRDLRMVPELFQGYVYEILKDIPEISVDSDDWRTALLSNLEKLYLEKDCNLCDNLVPDEGIVLRLNKGNYFRVVKLKSFRFKERESKQLFSGEVDIETIESDL